MIGEGESFRIEALERRMLLSGGGTISGRAYAYFSFSLEAPYYHQAADQTVFLDANNNDRLDHGERSAQTGTDGKYEFANLAAGTSVVRHVLPAKWVHTIHAHGWNVTLSAGQTITTRDIFYAREAWIT